MEFGISGSGIRGREDAPKKWFVKFRMVKRPLLRVFCFPYAGGSASAYRRWAEAMPEEIEIVAIQLPGRETRIGEALVTDFQHIVRNIYDALLPYGDEPFVLFGHSLGALFGFELARFLRQRGNGPGLLKLIVSGCAAPYLRKPDIDGPLHNLSDDHLIEKLRKFNGTPNEVFDNNEMLALALPILRADFCLADTYQYVAGPRLNVPISVFCGTDDNISETELVGWRQHTDDSFSLRKFPGDHFFINSYRDLVLNALVDELGREILCRRR